MGYTSNLYAYCDNNCILNFDNDGKAYRKVDSTKDGQNTLYEYEMTAEEFCEHLCQAADENWPYVKSGAQITGVDCVGLYKCIMEWYYMRSTFRNITRIMNGDNEGKIYNQVNDMRKYGVRWGHVYSINDYSDLPIGSAVFVYNPDSPTASDNNQGWIHVGYYIGKTDKYVHTVVEAYDTKNGVIYSNLEKRNFNYYGLLNGISY